MTAGAAAGARLLHLLLPLPLLLFLVAVHLRCVDPLAIPHGRDPGAALDEVDQNLDAMVYLKTLPRGPAVAPHKKAPQFMLDLFDAVSVSDGTPKSQKEILEGNIVRSFEDKGHAGERFHFFNLSSVGKDERMIKAEFRWFRKKQVDVYEVLDSRVKPWRGNLITSRLVPLYTQGWEVFNVTQTVSHCLLLSAFQIYDKMADINAYLVIFSDDGRTGASNQSYLGQVQPAAAVPELHTHRSSRRQRAAPVETPHGRPRPCHRVPLFVDFEEIGWSGWIISPRGYNAYHCRGSCPFPLGGSLRATNHATVRSIMHALKLSSDNVGAPCCVPDKLQSISLLYFDDEENVVLKQYDDMVALSCGCH
uniref:TGF-beta family profile domain-containing protein n=1 Tax=Sphaeramia orbicularis TaxID=375764 RepID=A0A672YVU9_9TELE